MQNSQQPTAIQEVQESANTHNNVVSVVSPVFEPGVEKAEIAINSLNYFRVPINYKYYAAYKATVDLPINKKAISKFWKHLSTKDYPFF